MDEGNLKAVAQVQAFQSGFARRFNADDVALLARMDALHNTLSGPATQKLMALACQVFGGTQHGVCF